MAAVEQLEQKIQKLQTGDSFDQTVVEIMNKTGQSATHNAPGTEIFHFQEPVPKVIPGGPLMFGGIALPPELLKN